jgi:hypothetical protein
MRREGHLKYASPPDRLGSGIDAIICQFEAAAMPQHVRVNFHIEPGGFGRAFHHGLEASG